MLLISIHAPRVGCDLMPQSHSALPSHFNPRTPCGVRLLLVLVAKVDGDISIHAPRVGCDCNVWSVSVVQRE